MGSLALKGEGKCFIHQGLPQKHSVEAEEVGAVPLAEL